MSQKHRKTILNHLDWVRLPSKDLAVETALHRVMGNGEGIPNDIMPEAFGSTVMFATIEYCTEAVENDRRHNCSARLFSYEERW